ncbi:MAG TPA: hypothetical protein VFS21_39505 [Roseiflexaceae bacterium]|nr:hypothetical protein [Roseiflexaceae bacterium]
MRQLGYLVWWHLAGVRLSPAELRARLVAAGFPLPVRRSRPRTSLDSRSRLLVQAIERVPGAVGVRPEGGVVFAPHAAEPHLERLRDALAGLATTDPTPAGLYLLTVASTPENRAMLAETVTAGLLQDIAALGRELDHLQTKSSLIRPRTLDDRLVRLQALRERAAFHTALLTKVQRGVVTAAVAALARRIEEARAQ